MVLNLLTCKVGILACDRRYSLKLEKEQADIQGIKDDLTDHIDL